MPIHRIARYRSARYRIARYRCWLARVVVVVLAVMVLPTPELAARDEPQLTLQLGHTEGVLDVDLYRVGKEDRVVTVGRDERIKVWRAGDGSLLSTWEWTGRSRPDRLFVDPRGESAIIFPRSGPVVRLDLESGKMVDVPGLATAGIKAICQSNDRRHLAIARSKAPVQLLAMPGLEPTAQTPVSLSSVRVCRFGQRDHLLATGEGSGHVSFFDLRKDLRPLDRRRLDSLLIDDLAQHPKRGHWAVMGRKETVVWDLKGRKELGRWRTRGSNGFIRWTADGKHLIVGTHGSRALRHVDPATGKRVAEVDDDLYVPKGQLDTFRWLNDIRGAGPLYALKRRDDPTVEVWNADAGQRVSTLWSHPNFMTGLSFMASDRHLAIGTSDGRVLSWDLAASTARPVPWKGHTKAVTAIASSPDGRWLASADASGRVIVRDRKSGAIDRNKRFGSDIRRLQFLADSETLLIQSDRRSRLFNVVNGFDGDFPEELAKARLVTWASKARTTAWLDGNTIQVRHGDASPKPIGGVKKPIDLVLSPAGDQLIAATRDGRLLSFNTRTGRPIGELNTGGVTVQRLSWDPKGRILAGLGDDAAIRFWARGEAEPRVALLLDSRGEWIAWQQSGAYDASAGGAHYVAWKVGKRLYPVSRFREQFQVPGLMRLQLAKEVPKLGLSTLEHFSPPPEVRIVSPEPYGRTDDDIARITVEAADAGGGLSEIRLYHQGRLVEELRHSSGDQHLRRSFEVLLEPGPNEFVATALSSGRIESRTPATRVVYGEAREQVRMRLLAVGINEYKDASLRLKHARADAEAVAAALEAGGKRLFRGGFEARVVTDSNATRGGVINGFEWLIDSTRADDVAVVYLAGHGDTVDEEYYFLPQELRYTNLDAVKDRGISQTTLRELIRRIPARKVVVLLDTCKSGAVSLGFASRSLGEKKALSLLGQAAGIYLIAASTSRQLALEDSKLGHGLFTWSLLRGLEGHADFDGDKAVSIRELVTFLESEVARVSRESFDQEQFPVTHGNGRNFPIAIPTTPISTTP